MSEVDTAQTPASLGHDLIGEIDCVGDQDQGEETHEDVHGDVSVPALLIYTNVFEGKYRIGFNNRKCCVDLNDSIDNI